MTKYLVSRDGGAYCTGPAMLWLQQVLGWMVYSLPGNKTGHRQLGLQIVVGKLTLPHPSSPYPLTLEIWIRVTIARASWTLNIGYVLYNLVLIWNKMTSQTWSPMSCITRYTPVVFSSPGRKCTKLLKFYLRDVFLNRTQHTKVTLL